MALGLNLNNMWTPQVGSPVAQLAQGTSNNTTSDVNLMQSENSNEDNLQASSTFASAVPNSPSGAVENMPQLPPAANDNSSSDSTDTKNSLGNNTGGPLGFTEQSS